MINMELAAGYRGYTAQIGSPITLAGPPTDMVRKFWRTSPCPATTGSRPAPRCCPGKNAKAMQDASRFFRDKGVQSRPDAMPRHRRGIVTETIRTSPQTTSAAPTAT